LVIGAKGIFKGKRERGKRREKGKKGKVRKKERGKEGKRGNGEKLHHPASPARGEIFIAMGVERSEIPRPPGRSNP